MAKRTKFSTSIFSTILVLIVTTVFLSYVNINNHKDGVIEVKADEIKNPPILFEEQFANQAFVFQNEQELEAVFPDLTQKIDFEKYIVGAYISEAQSNPGYSLKSTKTSRQNDTIEVTYIVEEPDSDKIYSSVIAYPTLLIAISRTGLAAITTHSLKFTNETTKNSTNTKFDLDEN